jgi:hypothetical protein
MSHSQSSVLEVTGAILNCARVSKFHFGEDTALVAVQHMLLQTVDLFQQIAAIGINVNNIFALGKFYSNSPVVIRMLREMGVTVLDSSAPAPGEFHSYFRRDVERLWRVVTEQLRDRRIKRILILDDGGICITNVPAEVRERYHVCGVEQTSQGVFLFARNPPPFAVICWARSAVKLDIGGPIFSRSFIDKLNAEYLHGRSIAGAHVGIIGLGSIGRSTARLAVRQGAKVLFYDPDERVASPPSAPIQRAASLEELMVNCEYVVGCSGCQPFKHHWPLNYRRGVKLFSASGGDSEFGPIINDLKLKPDFAVDPVTCTITSKMGPSGPLEIAYLGYPYNFVSRAPEAVPTRIVQLETGGLLAALIQARLHLQVSETKRNENVGLHSVTSTAQRVVFDVWLKTMRELGIDPTDLFAIDPEVLSAAEQDEWFARSDLPPVKLEETEKEVTELMTRLLGDACAITSQEER